MHITKQRSCGRVPCEQSSLEIGMTIDETDQLTTAYPEAPNIPMRCPIGTAFLVDLLD